MQPSFATSQGLRNHCTFNMNLQGQDWGEVVIRKKKPTAAQAQTESAVNTVRTFVLPVDFKHDVPGGSSDNLWSARRLGDKVQKLTRSRNVIALNPALLVIGGTVYHLHAAVSFGDLICCHCRLSWCKQDDRDWQGCSQIG